MPKERIYPPSPHPDASWPLVATVYWARGERVQVSVDDVNTDAASICASLDRRQVNTLIQTLRKARDQAYGQDA